MFVLVLVDSEIIIKYLCQYLTILDIIYKTFLVIPVHISIEIYIELRIKNNIKVVFNCFLECESSCYLGYHLIIMMKLNHNSLSGNNSFSTVLIIIKLKDHSIVGGRSILC